MQPPQRTARFRRQHAELATLVGEVLAHLKDLPAVGRDPMPVRRALAVLAGKLKVHAAMEDEALYPSLLAHKDERLRDIAKSFRARFGEVYEAFFAFLDHWSTEAIAADPAAFAEATGGAMKALATRVQLENEVLYAEVDAAEAREGG